MRQNGISVVRTRKHKVTTDSDHKFNIAPNLLDRDFMAGSTKPEMGGRHIDISGQARVGLYLAVILDLYSRRVIGWAVSNPVPSGIWLSGHWTWPSRSGHRPGAAFTTRIVARRADSTGPRNTPLMEV